MKEVVLFVVFVFLLVFAIPYFIADQECKVKSVSFEKHEFSFIGGCMVLHKGRWLPLENIRGFDDK